MIFVSVRSLLKEEEERTREGSGLLRRDSEEREGRKKWKLTISAKAKGCSVV